MKKQLKILESIIGKNLSEICFNGSVQRPFPLAKNRLFTYDKFCLACSGENSTTQYQYTIDPVYQEYPNYHNPFKFKISEENVLTIKTPEGTFFNKEYGSVFKIDFVIGSIYVYEDDNRSNEEADFTFIEEVQSTELLGSTIVLNDETGLRNIWLTTYEIPSEQAENETEIMFRVGNIFREHNITFKDRKKLLAKIGKAPFYR